MVSPTTILTALASAIRDSGQLPSSTTYATLELDPSGEHSDLTLPILEITISSLDRDQTRNTEVVRHETDADGNQIGEIYRSKFEMAVQFDCIATGESSVDSREMTESLREALRQYDTRQLGSALPNPDGTAPLNEVTSFVTGAGRVVNDLSMTPAMRRSRTAVECTFVDEFSSVDYEGPMDYITTVTSPADGDTVTDSTTDADLDLITSVP